MRLVKLFTSKSAIECGYISQSFQAKSTAKLSFLDETPLISHRFLQSGVALSENKEMAGFTPQSLILASRFPICIDHNSQTFWSGLKNYEYFTSILCARHEPVYNLAVKANPEPVAYRELSPRASHEVAGKTAHCSPGFLSLIHESACEYVTVTVNLP